MGFFDKFRSKKAETVSNVEKKTFILCHEDNSDTMLGAFDAILGTNLAGGGVNNGTLHNGDLEIQVVTFGADLGDECKEFVQKQANNVCGYVHSIDTKHVDIKINAIHQLLRSHGFIVANYTYPGAENPQHEAMVIRLLCDVCSRVNGLLLIDEGTTVLNPEGKIILNQKGESQLEWFMPYEIPSPAEYWQGAPAEALARRDRSLEKLRARHIFVTEWLPLVETEETAHFRTAEEIAGRAAALLIVALYSEGILGDKMSIADSREFIKPIIADFNADKYFSPAEKAYLEDDHSTEQQQIQFAWQYEPLMVMLWALGYEKELFYPDRICDVPGIVRIMKEHGSIEALVADAKLRSHEELLDEADLIYRMDWACVDTRIHGLPAPAGMDGGVVMERHKSLNWLILEEDWDEVDTNT
ncbi:MAG: DUF4272 domain-containing protein [Lachnospiraceae bacterium]|nr:DUF4272 domain-containing protein [Lachnospiraceae bacterium]